MKNNYAKPFISVLLTVLSVVMLLVAGLFSFFLFLMLFGKVVLWEGQTYAQTEQALFITMAIISLSTISAAVMLGMAKIINYIGKISHHLESNDKNNP